MSYTLAQLKTRMRLQLGEPTDGTFSSSLNYQDETGVDEVRLALREAQKRVCEDCLMLKHPLLIGRTQIVVESGVYQYGLPADFMSVQLLQHFHDGTFYTMAQHPVQFLYDRVDPTALGTRYSHYDVEGVTALIIDEGVMTAATASNTVLTNGNTDFSTLGIRANVDTVFNVRDNSRANITTIGTTTLTTDGLVGGKSNLFQRNDRYIVESGEEQRQLLWVYPPVSGEDTEVVVAEQTGLTFTMSANAVLYSIEVKLSAAQTNPVRVQLEDNAAPGTPISATDPESVASIAVSAVGYNEAVFEYGIRLNTTTTYLIVVTDGAGASVTPTHIKVNGYTGNEYLMMHYARYPRVLTNGTDVCELPDYAIPALLANAEIQLLPKVHGGRSQAAADARLEYQFEIDKIKRLLRSNNREGLRAVQHHGRSRMRHKNVPLNIPLPLR